MERVSSHAARILAVLCLIGAGVGCAPGQGNNSGEKGLVSGTVTTTTVASLPADAEVKVQLTDISRADAEAPVVAETTLTTAGQQFPVPFELSYASDTIDPQHNYAVRAMIESDGKTLYTTDTSHPVITGGNDNNVELTLVSTGEVADTTGGMTPLAGTKWQLLDVLGDAIAPDTRPTLEFSDDGRVSGNATCNNFSGPVTLSGTTLKFGPLAATKKACVDEAANAQEVKYLAALGDAESFRVEGTTLIVNVKGMSTPLRFSRTEPKP